MLTKAEYENLWNDNFSKVYNFFYYRLMNHHTSEDLTSITFLKLYENMQNYDKNRSMPITYLMKIAQNTLTDYYREHRNEPVLGEFDIEDIQFSEEEALDRILLQKILLSLSERDRQILYYRYYLDMSYAEIAELMDITRTNSSTLCSRALIRAKKFFEKKFESNVTKSELNPYIKTGDVKIEH